MYRKPTESRQQSSSHTNRRRDLFPCGVTRREFVWEMGGGFAGLALAGLLASDGFSPPRARAAEAQSADNPLAPKPAHFAGAKSCIFLMMNGGPSQVDTFDYKPELEKYAGKPLPEGKKFINSGGRKIGYLTAAQRPFRPGGESGLLISDFFENVRRHADKLAIIKSCHADSHAHGSALVQMNTGSTFIGRPSLGSWSVYGLGSENQNLPGYVVMLDKRGGPISGQPNWSSGFMPAAFQGTLFRPAGDPILDLRGPEYLDRQAQRSQLDLLAELNQRHLDQRPGGDELAARIASYELAYRMQSSALEVGNLEEETRHTQRSYGLMHDEERTRSFGRKCLLARRLVERGVRFVQLYDMPDLDGWDAHSKLTENHTPRARWTDQPVAALLDDLKQRGLLDETLVIWASEFGRTPLLQGDGGRNHNSAGFTIWLAGGGVKPGQRIGATDEVGYLAVDRPTHFRDLHATILAALGLDNDDLYFHDNGRNERLTGVAGSAKVIPGVLA